MNRKCGLNLNFKNCNRWTDRMEINDRCGTAVVSTIFHSNGHITKYQYNLENGNLTYLQIYFVNEMPVMKWISEIIMSMPSVGNIDFRIHIESCQYMSLADCGTVCPGCVHFLFFLGFPMNKQNDYQSQMMIIVISATKQIKEKHSSQNP